MPGGFYIIHQYPLCQAAPGRSLSRLATHPLTPFQCLLRQLTDPISMLVCLRMWFCFSPAYSTLCSGLACPCLPGLGVKETGHNCQLLLYVPASSLHSLSLRRPSVSKAKHGAPAIRNCSHMLLHASAPPNPFLPPLPLRASAWTATLSALCKLKTSAEWCCLFVR